MHTQQHAVALQTRGSVRTWLPACSKSWPPAPHMRRHSLLFGSGALCPAAEKRLPAAHGPDCAGTGPAQNCNGRNKNRHCVKTSIRTLGQSPTHLETQQLSRPSAQLARHVDYKMTCLRIWMSTIFRRGRGTVCSSHRVFAVSQHPHCPRRRGTAPTRTRAEISACCREKIEGYC